MRRMTPESVMKTTMFRESQIFPVFLSNRILTPKQRVLQVRLSPLRRAIESGSASRLRIGVT
jgi:hypothetical protein